MRGLRNEKSRECRESGRQPRTPEIQQWHVHNDFTGLKARRKSMNIYDEPKIDCHLHIFDPRRFPYAADAKYRSDRSGNEGERWRYDHPDVYLSNQAGLKCDD